MSDAVLIASGMVSSARRSDGSEIVRLALDLHRRRLLVAVTYVADGRVASVQPQQGRSEYINLITDALSGGRWGVEVDADAETKMWAELAVPTTVASEIPCFM